MGIFHFPENEGTDGLRIQSEDLGEFRIQKLLGIVHKILVRLVEFPSGRQLHGFIAVKAADHPHDTDAVTAA